MTLPVWEPVMDLDEWLSLGGPRFGEPCRSFVVLPARADLRLRRRSGRRFASDAWGGCLVMFCQLREFTSAEVTKEQGPGCKLCMLGDSATESKSARTAEVSGFSKL